VVVAWVATAQDRLDDGVAGFGLRPATATADNFVLFLLLWVAQPQGWSGVQTALVVLALRLPTLASGVLLGRAVDRWGARPLLLLDLTTRTVLLLAMAVAGRSGDLPLPAVLVLGGISGAVLFLVGGAVWGPYTAVEIGALQRWVEPGRHGAVFGLQRSLLATATPARCRDRRGGAGVRRAGDGAGRERGCLRARRPAGVGEPRPPPRRVKMSSCGVDMRSTGRPGGTGRGTRGGTACSAADT
jgi:hypothetical protein